MNRVFNILLLIICVVLLLAAIALEAHSTIILSLLLSLFLCSTRLTQRNRKA